MPKLFIKQLPFNVSLAKKRKNGFYADINPDKSIKALYDYEDGKCVYEAHFDKTYRSGHAQANDHFRFAEIGYIDGWTDFDGTPAMEVEKFDKLSAKQQEPIAIYEEFVEWVKHSVFHHFTDKHKTHEIACSFCEKSRKEVLKLIAGPSCYICNECIAMCSDIMEMESGNASSGSPPG